MDSWRKYGAQLDDTPMETELSSWLKEIGYKGEALKAGNLRGLCDDQEVIDALFFMMQRLRPAESARRFRTQIGKYESLDKAREASEKVIAGKLREAREDVKDYREKREGGYWECESSGKTLRGLQGALVEQESRWQYEANVTVREQRVKRRALKAATGKVKRSVEELQSRLAGLKDLVEHARQQREEKIEGIGNRPGASLVNVHSRKLMKVLRREEGRIGLAEQPLDLAQKVEGKHEKAGGSDLSADVREELEKLMKNGGAHYMSEGLHQAAINAQSKLLDFASGLDVDGGSCLEDERFGYAQPMIDRLRAQHLQEALRNEALWNEVSEKEATFSQKYAEDTDHRVGGAMDAERMEIMIKLSVARADVETIKSNIDLIRKRSGGYGESLSFQVQNLQTRCLKNAEKSAELDRAVEQTFKQILRLKSRIQKVRESDDKYYSLKIIHQCDQAIKQAQIPVDLQAEVDAMGHMKLGMHLLQNSHETGAVSQHVDRSLWGSQEAGKTHMLQCLDWSLQAKHYTQLQDGALDPKGQEIWRWLRVNNAMNNPTSSVWAPDLFLQQIFHHANSGENKSVLIRSINGRQKELENDFKNIPTMVSSCREKHKYLQNEHTEHVWNQLDLVSNEGSSLHFELQTEFRKILECYKDFTIFKKANFVVLKGADGKTGTISYWMSLWDESTSFLNYRKGLVGRSA